MSVCVADKVILLGGGNKSLLFHRITQRRMDYKRTGNNRFPYRSLVNSFKMSTYLCSGMGLYVFSFSAMRGAE